MESQRNKEVNGDLLLLLLLLASGERKYWRKKLDRGCDSHSKDTGKSPLSKTHTRTRWVVAAVCVCVWERERERERERVLQLVQLKPQRLRNWFSSRGGDGLGWRVFPKRGSCWQQLAGFEKQARGAENSKQHQSSTMVEEYSRWVVGTTNDTLTIEQSHTQFCSLFLYYGSSCRRSIPPRDHAHLVTHNVRSWEEFLLWSSVYHKTTILYLVIEMVPPTSYISPSSNFENPNEHRIVYWRFL